MTYIIAELGSVPDGSLGNALALIGACVAAGADAVKLQDHRGERIKGDPPWYRGHEQRGDYLKRTSFTQEQWLKIRQECDESDVDLVVSPFSVEAVALLEELPVDAYKIASGQVTNLPMLHAIAATGRKTYWSSGMSTDAEDLEAQGILTFSLGPKAVRMVCTSSYPCPPELVGLNRIAVREDIADWVVGLSDHTLGVAASLAAIALGATVIERHVTFHRGMYGTDARHSLTLDEFGAFVKEVRALDVMLANRVDKDALVQTPQLQAMRAAFLEVP